MFLCVEFSPDGKLIAAGSSEGDGDTGGMVRIWRLKDGKQLHKYPGRLDQRPGSVHSVAVCHWRFASALPSDSLHLPLPKALPDDLLALLRSSGLSEPHVATSKTGQAFPRVGRFALADFLLLKGKPLLTNDRRRGYLAESVDAACRDQRFRLVAFVIMPFHVYLIIDPVLQAGSITDSGVTGQHGGVEPFEN